MGRKRIRDLRQQLVYTVNKNFKKGMDKHSIKKVGACTSIFKFKSRNLY